MPPLPERKSTFVAVLGGLASSPFFAIDLRSLRKLTMIELCNPQRMFEVTEDFASARRRLAAEDLPANSAASALRFFLAVSTHFIENF